jgi:heptosyltransferase II
MIVRLRNWIGDVVLSLPALELLAAQGWELILIGKPWARSLLSGTPWEVHSLPGTGRERRAQLRRLAARCRSQDPGFDGRVNTLVFPFSFSSALDARLAGLKALGFRHEARDWLLHRALALPQGVHEIHRYWQLACAAAGVQAPLPARLHLPVTAAARAQADALRKAHGIPHDYLMLCPFAGGLLAGQSRHWPGFPALAASLQDSGHTLVLCPGPKELELARHSYGRTVRLEGVALDTYAALIADARLMVSNDTGPGHMAAAVGTPLVSILGPTKPEQWHAWGERVQVLHAASGWPADDQVLAAVHQALSPAHA